MKLNQYLENNKTFKHKPSNEDLEQEDYSEENQLGYFVSSHQICNYTVPIDGSFREPAYYRGVIQMLMGASQHDTVAFLINSPGGALSGLLSLLEAINMTEANTVALLVGNASSAASIFALHCNEVYVGDNSTLLCHNISYGTGGKGSDVLAHVQHISNSASKLLRKTYKYFLNDKEIDDMLNGKEIYMEAEEIIDRLQKREELRDKEQLLLQEQEQKAQEPKPKRKGK